MLRFNLEDGVMVESAQGEYCLYSDVVAIDIKTADTLITQLDGLKEQIEGWYAE
jgi:hypothetical protein